MGPIPLDHVKITNQVITFFKQHMDAWMSWYQSAHASPALSNQLFGHIFSGVSKSEILPRTDSPMSDPSKASQDSFQVLGVHVTGQSMHIKQQLKPQHVTVSIKTLHQAVVIPWTGFIKKEISEQFQVTRLSCYFAAS